MSPSRVPAGGQRGPIMAVGGAEEKAIHSSILQHYWSLAGSYGARIVVLAMVGELEDQAQDIARSFKEMESARAEVVPVRSREAALNPDSAAGLEGATAVFITGSNPMRLAGMIGGTSIAQLLRRMNAHGVLIGGIGSGAAILTEHMVSYRGEEAESYQRSITFTPGLGLTNRLIIDQHFAQHRLFDRLMAAVAHNPFLLGVGLEKDTAVVLDSSNSLTVVGQRNVVIVDGGALSYTDIHEVPADKPIAMLGLRVHMLTHDHMYQVDERKASPPDPELARVLKAQEETFDRASRNGSPPQADD